MKIEAINTQEDYEDFCDYLIENPDKQVEEINKPYIHFGDFKFKISSKFPQAFDNIIEHIQGKKIKNLAVLSSPKLDDTEDCLFGKDKRKRITNVDVKNDELHIFYADGKTELLPCVYWVLAEKNLDGKFELLDGNCEYKYVKSFTKEEDLKSFKKRFYGQIYVIADLVEQQLTYYGITVHKDLAFGELRVLSFDIESTGTQHDKNAQILIISNTYDDGITINRDVFILEDYKDVGEMLEAWCDAVAKYNPSVITGHNIIGFDLPYMNFIAKRAKVDLTLGRDRSVMTINSRASNYRVDGSQVWEFKNIKIFGREVVDGMFLAVKYDIGRNFPSWGLKPIIESLGLIAEGRQFYDASMIGKNWSIPEERAKIIEYCKFDGDDSLALYKLMGASLFYAARSIPKSFQTIINTATGGWLNSIMVRAYIQNDHSIPKANEYSPVTGGISFGVPGIHKNVWKIDIASLYPSIMRNYKINDPKKDPNNVFFKLVDFNTKARLEYKKKGNETGDKYYKDLDASSKVFINSAYGLLGTGKVNYNNFQNADFITSVGRRILSLTMVWATGGDVGYWFHPEYTLDGEYKNTEYDKQYEKYLDLGEFIPHNFVIVNADTDSISIKKEDESEFTEQERKDLLVEINELLPELLNYEDDGYFQKFVVNKAKNYILYDGKKIKLKGSSFKDAKKEPVMKEMMNKIISEYLIHETRDYVEIYEEYIQEVYNMKDIKRWAGKKNITEKVMKNDRTTEAKVREALDEMDEDFVIGDKVFLYSAIDGEAPDLDKDGNPKIYKRTGLVKMIPKRVLKHIDLFNNDHDVDHYLKRVYDTINIFSNILDMDRIKKYKGNNEL
jgi:DNA polymerase elongation subunit (family B)